MRMGCRIIAIIFIFIISSVTVFDDADGSFADDIKIIEVNPFGNYEGISLFNYGDNVINLRGWSLSDGEGTITFTKDIHIHPSDRMTIVNETGGDWFSSRDNTFAIGTEGIEKKGSYILSNTGDDIYLINNGNVIDAVCYGNKTANEGWIGDPVSMPSGKYILRISSKDTDSASDWISTKPCLTNHTFDPDLVFDAVVTPFAFPESDGDLIFRMIEDAEEEVLISMYIMTSVDLVALLCDIIENKGIKVSILLEGDVLGYDISTELTLMKRIVDSGGEVHLINDPIPGNFERYSYVHNKYAVIDGKNVIITSENWTESNLGKNGSNRGWGVVVDSMGFADYVKDVFLNDSDLSYGDVKELTEEYPDVRSYPGTLTYSGREYEDMIGYDARVTPILSPDNSFDALKHIMNNSVTRIYAQQLDLGSSFRLTDTDSPIKWMSESSKRDVDCRFILDSSVHSKRSAVKDGVNMINSTTGIKAITSDSGENFIMTHNKGVIIDDMTWVGSVNWTENSFRNNRELAVLVDSFEVTEFFSEMFTKDWGENQHTVQENGLEIELCVIDDLGKELLLFTSSGPVDAIYHWDILGDGNIRTSYTNRIVCSDLPPGSYTVTVIMKDGEHSAYLEYEVAERPPRSEGGSIWKLILAVTSIGVGSTIAMVKGRYNIGQKGIRSNDHKADDNF